MISFGALSALFLSACTPPTPSDTWVLPNQNAQNTRYAGGRITTSTVQTLGVAWTADIKARGGVGAIAPSPLITANTVFVTQVTGGQAALDLTTGRPATGVLPPNARVPAAAANSIVAPVSTTGGNDARIVVTADAKAVIQAHGSNGGLVWQRQPEAAWAAVPRVLSNMAAADGKIFVAVADLPRAHRQSPPSKLFGLLQGIKNSTGSLVALNTSNGDVSWSKPLSSAPLGAATVVNDIVFTTTTDGHLYGFNRDDGDEVFSSQLPAGSIAPIAVSGGTIIVPASLATHPGQKPQVVAFAIGGLGQIGGATAPVIQKRQQAAQSKPAQQQPAAAPAAAPDAKAVFTQNCAGCHTLAAAGAKGAVGPNLDNLKPGAAIVARQVINGGGAMPSFKGTLTPAQIKAVSRFVASVAGR